MTRALIVSCLIGLAVGSFAARAIANAAATVAQSEDHAND